MGKRGVELNIEIKKKESEPPYENTPHDWAVLEKLGAETEREQMLYSRPGVNELFVHRM